MPYLHLEYLQVPNQDQLLWRYLDFAKFTYLIRNQSLYFPSLTQLLSADPWEGLPSPLNFDYPDPIMDKLHKESHFGVRKTMFVNCWHINDGESDSQWKIYGRDTMSLAIVTRFTNLAQAISDPKKIHGSVLSYYDPKKERTSELVIEQALSKRKAFEHEKEFRLFIWDHKLLKEEHPPEGLVVAINIKMLIEKIIINPLAPQWFIELVGAVLNDYGLEKICVERSTILESLAY
ncbi:hypothetical protein [uncultured Legionella sp.]|uniref:hypothetical protein n=1 Tax=uncultured Legionella sp. TaxID=210934 RepID=UPI0026270468|nr:hypothetical protein [uncultured Legionella sp.]